MRVCKHFYVLTTPQHILNRALSLTSLLRVVPDNDVESGDQTFYYHPSGLHKGTRRRVNNRHADKSNQNALGRFLTALDRRQRESRGLDILRHGDGNSLVCNLGFTSLIPESQTLDVKAQDLSLCQRHILFTVCSVG